MTWLESSILARSGVAKGRPGITHKLTEAVQGPFNYVYGPYADPVLRIEPGDIVVVETVDAFEGRITSETDEPSAILNFPFLNPQCGPIAVNGAEKGDVLAVLIQSIEPRGEQPICLTSAPTGQIPGFERRRISGSSQPLWSEDEQEIRNIEGCR